jgi:hypothetical protein
MANDPMDRAPGMASGLFFESEHSGSSLNCMDITEPSPFRGEGRERVFDE